MKEWMYTEQEAAYLFEPQIVRVRNDEALKRLFQDRLKASAALAVFLRDRYRELYQEELRITRESLAVELYLHYLAQEVLLKLKKRLPKSRLAARLLRSTEIIDCGDLSRDGNRFFWDLLSRFIRKEKLFTT